MLNGATEALRQASFDRLTSARETRESELERYFSQMRSQVGALASDDSTVNALEQFQAAWGRIPKQGSVEELREIYRKVGAPETWLPSDPETVAVQHVFLAENSNPQGRGTYC